MTDREIMQQALDAFEAIIFENDVDSCYIIARNARYALREELATPDATFIGEGSKPEQCDWNYDDDGMWQTGCGKELSFEMHHPEDSVKFCQGCGKPAHFVEPSEGEKE